MCVPRKNLCALVFCAVQLSACMISHAPSTGGSQPGTLTVEIDNREFADFRIYLVRNGANLPLGCVEGLTKRSLVVPAAYGARTAELGLIAVTLSGSEILRSPIVAVGRGQVVSWRVEHVSRGSAIMVK